MLALRAFSTADHARATASHSPKWGLFQSEICLLLAAMTFGATTGKLQLRSQARGQPLTLEPMLRLWLLTGTCQHLGLWPLGLWRRLARRLDRHHAPRLTMTTKRR